MIKNSYYLISFALLVSLGALGWYIAKPETLKLLDEKTLANTPDTIIKQLTVKKYDKEGKLSHTLNSPLMKRIPNDNISIFVLPTIISFQGNQSPWIIKAKQGKALHGSDKIILTSNVVVHQASSPTNQRTDFETELLNYYPSTQLADTPLAARLTQPGTLIQSIGMKANLNKKTISFLKQMRGRHETS